MKFQIVRRHYLLDSPKQTQIVEGIIKCQTKNNELYLHPAIALRRVFGNGGYFSGVMVGVLICVYVCVGVSCQRNPKPSTHAAMEGDRRGRSLQKCVLTESTIWGEPVLGILNALFPQFFKSQNSCCCCHCHHCISVDEAATAR